MTNIHLPHSLLIDIECANTESPSHSHDFHQLILPIGGVLELEIDGVLGKIDQDSIAFASATNKHAFCVAEENRFIIANVPTVIAETLADLPAFITLSPSIKSYIHFIATQLKSQPSSQINQEPILMMLLDLITQQLDTSGQIDKRIKLARNFLDAHIASHVTLTQVAMSAHLSVRQLSHLFKQELGLSPLHYLREQRMKKALTLLKQTQLSIQIVAETVGYHSLSAFSDRFRQHFGKSPRHFR
ncbi:MAG: AraC family transcriptional regulator [Colwellia sp.]|nr:AraC family transcriptional regulator [Colwellia sp.]